MRLKHLASAAAIAASVAMSGLSIAAVPAHADPPGPCNPPNCPGGPAGPPPQNVNNWRAPDQGAPRPPDRGQQGWNDGPPPGGPPHGWAGPPPPGGWNGAPPPGGWNRHWDGPDRDIDQGRFDHQPFEYYGYQAVPIWSPDMGGWGFWFFGVWIPL
jgi:hypothetical protein